MLADLRWGASSHKDVLDNNYAFMKSCQAQQAALVDDLQQDQECFECDEEELRAETPINDTTSAAYMEAQRQMLYAHEHAAQVDPQMMDMLHTDVDNADDSMHHHEAVRCALDLVWLVEATSQHKRASQAWSVCCGVLPSSSISHARGPNSPLPCTGCHRMVHPASSGAPSSQAGKKRTAPFV